MNVINLLLYLILYMYLYIVYVKVNNINLNIFYKRLSGLLVMSIHRIIPIIMSTLATNR